MNSIKIEIGTINSLQELRNETDETLKKFGVDHIDFDVNHKLEKNGDQEYSIHITKEGEGKKHLFAYGKTGQLAILDLISRHLNGKYSDNELGL